MKLHTRSFIFFVGLGFVFGSDLFSMSMGNQEKRNSEDEMFCAADAQLCPDGSYVSRDPKNDCKFRPCPGGTKTSSPFEAESCPSSTEGKETCSERKEP